MDTYTTRNEIDKNIFTNVYAFPTRAMELVIFAHLVGLSSNKNKTKSNFFFVIFVYFSFQISGIGPLYITNAPIGA